MPISRTLRAILPGLLLIAAALLASEASHPADAGSSDLAVDGYFYDPSNPVVGQSVTVTIYVANLGESSTGDFNVDFYQNRVDPPTQSDAGDASCLMASLGPNSSNNCQVTATYLAPGQFLTWIQLDRDQQVFESDENNNIAGPNYVTVQTDSDGDLVGDQDDNCLFWPNPNQTLPSWPIPPNDSDCDGFTNAREQYLTTDLTLQCAANNVANNEPLPDFWPLDMNDDQRANTVDVGAFVGKLGLDNTEQGWTARLDLNQSANGIISTVDVGMYVGRLGNLCSPAGS
jgi:CARDB